MIRIACLLLVCALVAACGGNETPTTPTDNPTPAAPSIVETWEGTLTVGGSRFYSFAVSQFGTVNLTLTSLAGSDGELSTPVQVSIGFPAGTSCTAQSSATTVAGTDVHVTNPFNPGTWCARIADVGNLTAPARFRLVIAHP